MDDDEMSDELRRLLLPEDRLEALSGTDNPGDADWFGIDGSHLLHGFFSLCVGLAIGGIAAIVWFPDSRLTAAAALLLFAIAMGGAMIEVVWLVLAAIGGLVATVLATRALAHSDGLIRVASCTLLVTVGLYSCLRFLRAYLRRQRGLRAVERLHAHARHLNGIVRSVDIQDRLRAAQDLSIDRPAREGVLRSLGIARENLIRTLRVERILRENRGLLGRVSRTGHVVDLTPVAAVRVNDAAREYVRVIDETIALAMDVQQAFDELQTSRLHE